MADHRATAEGQRADVRDELNRAADELLSGRQQQNHSLEHRGLGRPGNRRPAGNRPRADVSDEKYKAIRKLADSFPGGMKSRFRL